MKNVRPEFVTRIITPTFRLSYPHVWEPVMNQLAKREEYSIQMLFSKKDDKAAMVDMVQLVKDMIDYRGWTGNKEVKKPFMDGDTKTDSAGVPYAEKNPAFKGMILVRSWSKQAPGIMDMTGKHPITQKDEIYGGCYCRAQLNAYTYDQAGNKGVSFGLMHIQKIKDGEPFGTRNRAEDAFAPVEAAEGAVADDTMFS